MGKTAYLLKLAASDYDEVIRIAKSEDVSIAHVLRRAVREYIKRISTPSPSQ